MDGCQDQFVTYLLSASRNPCKDLLLSEASYKHLIYTQHFQNEIHMLLLPRATILSVIQMTLQTSTGNGINSTPSVSKGLFGSIVFHCKSDTPPP
jgi:hypothetical protein